MELLFALHCGLSKLALAFLSANVLKTVLLFLCKSFWVGSEPIKLFYKTLVDNNFRNDSYADEKNGSSETMQIIPLISCVNFDRFIRFS